jgi:metal-dependent amidase/aminoacylase/carboxypeptidase family protein
VNDPVFTSAVHSKLQESFPELTVYPEIEKTFAAEDFASYLKKVPGIFISLGTLNPEKKIVEVNHSCKFDIDENILILGTEIFYTVSLDFLKSPEKYLNSPNYFNSNLKKKPENQQGNEKGTVRFAE